MCLDVLRALRREKEVAEFFGELARKSSPLIGKEAELFEPMNDFASEAAARVTVGKLATLAAAAALEATAPPTVTEAFVRTRVLQQHAGLYGADGLEELAMRVGIIRAGAVGSALALALVMRGAAREVVLVDRTRQRSRAVATDLQYGTPDRHWSIIRGGDFNDFTSAAPVIGRRRHQ
jgi:lactate/malate dehydrogenase, NAD binding domain